MPVVTGASGRQEDLRPELPPLWSLDLPGGPTLLDSLEAEHRRSVNAQVGPAPRAPIPSHTRSRSMTSVVRSGAPPASMAEQAHAAPPPGIPEKTDWPLVQAVRILAHYAREDGLWGCKGFSPCCKTFGSVDALQVHLNTAHGLPLRECSVHA
ncbi:hypothetical protein AURDEDRAFT_164594 [Auricularia subglabra TFB-10046 SS5]|nr:hypothetical protein AURDEDRAFT_164594 [Auricularia subglabra TFB-10046 SS5]